MQKIPKIMLQLDVFYHYCRGLAKGIARYSNLNQPWSFYTWSFYNSEFRKADPWVFQTNFDKKKLRDQKGEIFDGIIARDAPENEKLFNLGIPAIKLIGYEVPSDTPYITPDDDSVGKLAAEHLLSKGFINYAYSGFSPDKFLWTEARKEGFQEAINRAGYEVEVYNVERSRKNTLGDEIKHLAAWLKTLKKPVGLFACNDIRAFHAVEACKTAGIRIPEEVAIVGADNDELLCELSERPISSVSLNVEKAGFEAAELLDQMMKGQKPQKKEIVVMATHVVTRHSTDILAIDDESVRSSIRYIQKHINKDIQIDDIVKDAAISRRSLELKFRSVLGRSILDEVKRIRTEHMLKLLAESRLTISQIAEQLGFTSVDHISRYFKDQMGISLSDYKKKHTLIS